jgi:hypothetical protein
MMWNPGMAVEKEVIAANHVIEEEDEASVADVR